MSRPLFLLRSAAVLALAVATGTVAQASPYSAIYAFGDSLSDAGNLFLLSSNPANGIPHQPLPPYSAGRFTNGNTWVQDLSLLLGNGPLTASLAGGNDYAYGGARTGTTAVGAATFIDLPSQLGQFGFTHATVPSSALYTLSIGANDIFGALGQVAGGALTVAQAQAAIAVAAQNAADFAFVLQALGARQLVLYDVPNIGATPAYKGLGPLAALATALSFTFNADVQNDLALAEAAGLKVDTLGEFARLNAVIADPAAFGFSNVTDPCWTGGFQGPTAGATLCSTTAAGQDTYLFWDGVHPTEAGHFLVAQDALRAVPEPPTMMLLLTGLVGIGLLRHGATSQRLSGVKIVKNSG